MNYRRVIEENIRRRIENLRLRLELHTLNGTDPIQDSQREKELVDLLTFIQGLDDDS